MWSNHIPKLNITFPSQVLVSSGKRPYRKLTFHSVSARQGSSRCNKARLNFQVFALRDMKIAIREDRGVGQKMKSVTYTSLPSKLALSKISVCFSGFWTVLALEETFLSMCRRSKAIIFRFNSKTHWQMFLLLYGRHVWVPQKDTNMASPYKALQIWVTHFCK